MQVTKKDIGRTIIYKPLDMYAILFAVIDNEFWYKHIDSGAMCTIKKEDINKWEYLN